MSLRPFLGAIVFWSALSLFPVMATDLEGQPLNTVVTDRIVQVGSHRYPLPPGEWTLIAKQIGRTTGDGVRQGVKTVSGYFVTLQGSTFKSGLAIWSTANSSAVASSGGWTDEPCKRNDVLYKNPFDGNFKYPECLMINHYVGHLKVNNGWLEDAANWLQVNQISVPTTVLGATYNGFAYGDAVAFRVFVNPELANIAPSKDGTWRGNDWHKDRIRNDPAKQVYLQRFIAWSEQLPKVYRTALRKEASTATLTDLSDVSESVQGAK